MNRFHKQKSLFSHMRLLLPLFVFCIMFLLLLEGLSSVSSAAAREEASRLRDSVLQGAVQCLRAGRLSIRISIISPGALRHILQSGQIRGIL